MKHLATTLIFIALAFTSIGQSDSIKAPYLQVPIFPPVKLVLPNNSHFTKANLPAKKPVLLMVFNPECEHCQHETEEILKHIDWFEGSTIVMSTSQPLDSIKNFISKYKLTDHPNIIVGRDDQFFTYAYYEIRSLPFLAFYDAKRKLISVFRGSMPIDKVAAELKKPAIKK